MCRGSDVPDDYNRRSALLRFHSGDAGNFTSVTAMTYWGNWNSTDQVPQRAIDEGMIDRYGSLNPSDGGITSRSSLSFCRVQRSDDGQLQFSGYVIRYRLDLWSTFTYYLKDPLVGDQILQHDDRAVYGLKGSKSWFTELFGAPVTNVIGLQARVDDIRDVGIDSTAQRRVLGVRQNAGVLESNGALYEESSIRWRTFLRTTLGLREDEFDFDVKDKMLNADGSCNLNSDPLGCASGHKRASIFSPKLGIALGPWAATTYFVNVGEGYHSNDARGVTRSAQTSDRSAITPLTRATSAEMGLASDIVPRWHTTVDVFKLKLKSELVFDGDAGVTSPSGSTTRVGIEWGNVYRVNGWLSADLNAAVTRARFDGNSAPDDLGCSTAASTNPCIQPIGIVGRYVPNSPTNVIDAGLTARRESGFFGALRARHFGESPLIEDNSVKSPAYTTVDAQIGFRQANRWLVAVDVFNLADVKWNDIEYYYVSRLKNETSPQADYVVHPGTPRTFRGRFQYQF